MDVITSGEQIMRILFIAPEPFFQVRGTPLAVKRLLESFSDRGHTITVLAYPLGDPVNIPRVTIKRVPRWPGLREITIGPSWKKLLLDPLLFVVASVELLWARYDLIYGVEEGAFIGAPLAYVARKGLVFDMDSNMPDQIFTSGFIRKQWMLRLIARFERWVIGRSKAVVTVCGELTEHAKSLCPEAKIFQIEDTPVVLPSSESSIRRELSLHENILAVYTGNFEPYQGVDLLLESLPEALAQIEDLAVVLVGGQGDRLEWARQRVRALGVAERVHVLAQRPLHAMGPFLNEADILLSPRREGRNTPFKIFTYLASGKPVLATRLPTHTQILTDEVAYLVEPNTTDWSRGLVALAGDEELRRRLGQAGKQLVEDRFGAATYEAKIDALLGYLGGA